MDLRRRRLGGTDLEVSTLGLGAMGVIGHNHRDRRSAARVVHRALDLGVNLIDTAASYFDSEEVLGFALRGRWDRVVMATKSYMRRGRRFRAELEQSFSRLGTDHIHLYQIHHVQYAHELEQVLGRDGAYEILVREKERGRVGHIGITSHHPGVLVEALETGLFETVQFPLNPMEARTFAPVLDKALELGVGTLAMKPLSGGRLTSVEAALRYCASHPVSSVLVGCTTVEQVEQDVGALSGELTLSDAERRALEEEITELGDLFCRRCRYCEKVCKNGLPISDVFRAHDYLVLNQTYARTEYRKLGRPVPRCDECGACEQICPYDLPIRDMLQHAHGELDRSRAMDLAVRVLHATRMYDVTRRVYFRVRGARGLPRFRYLHRKDIERRRDP